MTNSSTPKVRLVKCPKCSQLLQESPDIPVYRCGGCGVILQAKHRKNDLKVVGRDLQKSDELPSKELKYTSEDKDPSGLTHDIQILSSAEHSVEFNDLRDQGNIVHAEHLMPKYGMSITVNGDQLGQTILCRGDQLGGDNQNNAVDNAERDEESSGMRSSTELDSHETDGSLEGNLERQVSKESAPVPEEHFTEETNGSDLKANMTTTSVTSSGINNIEEPVGEIIPPDASYSTGTHEEKFKRTSPRAFDRKMSMETIASTEYADPISEFGDTIAEVPGSPARSFHRYHDKLSSYDAPGRNFHDQGVYHLNHYGKEPHSTFTRERFGGEKYRKKNDHELRYPTINTRPSFSSSHEGGYWRSDRRELPPRVPANQRHQRSYYDYGAPSNQVPRYSRFGSSSHLTDMPAYPEPEKMKLLWMVHELEHQLKRTCNLEEMMSERMPAGSHWREKPSDFYYSHDQLDEEDFLGMEMPAYPRINERDNRWRYHSRYSKRPFSAEIAERSYLPKNSYYHPVDWRRSEPLPPPVTSHNRNFYGIRYNKSFNSPYSSCPSSPQRYMDSDFSPDGYEIRLDDENYGKEKEFEKYKEHIQLAKRHIMPAAGGAPWIICSHCSQLLQLPADFLVFKKKCHRVRCGSCSNVLKFSLQNRKQLVPYVRDAEAPPPSEVDDHGDSLHVTHLPLHSHVNDFVQPEIVSYSDDIGISCSTEGDPLCLTMLHSVGDHHDDSLETKRPLQKSGSSPLHRLLGYSSVSQVFRGP